MAPEFNSGDFEIKVEDSDDDASDPSERVPRKTADQKRPTEPEVKEHNFTRIPTPVMVVHCGREEQAGHRRRDPKSESAIPEIHED